MVLHLLGKKSWNVYNPANIARVRRDEEAARAREEAEEQRMQEADAARRLAILRGEIPPPLEAPAAAEAPSPVPSRDHSDRHTAGRKRKRQGEDDTDFEMRIARDRATAGDRARATNQIPSSTSLYDSRGHISLFPEAETAAPREPNEEAAREAARKERELKDQYQMRLVNAAGKDGQGLVDGGPWYASADGDASGALVPTKDVWGREDPKRKAREAARLDASDPLAAMKRGAKMVRELDKERRREVAERERELRMLEKEARERRRERRRREERDKRRRAGDSPSREHSRGRRDNDRTGKRDKSDARERYTERDDGQDRQGRSDRSDRPRRDGERRRARSQEDRDDRRRTPKSDHGRDRAGDRDRRNRDQR